MIARRSFLLFSASAVTLAACGGNGADKPKDTLNFSILSTESAQNMEGLWRPILADMEKQIGMKVKPFFSSNYTALIEAMRFKQTDVGWFSNASGLAAVRQSGAEVFARTFDPSGTDGYKSVIIVPKDSPIKSIEDLLKCDKSLNFGMGDRKSTSGTLVPMTYVFLPNNQTPESCFKNVKTANHQANLFAVAAGQLDAATNNSTAIRLNQERGQAQANNIRVIWESPTLPEDPIVWRKDLDPAIKEKVRQFFLTYGQGETPEAEKQRGYMKAISIGGFKPADDTHLLVVREMEAMEQVALAKSKKDPEAQAEGEKELAKVRAEMAAAQGKAGR